MADSKIGERLRADDFGRDPELKVLGSVQDRQERIESILEEIQNRLTALEENQKRLAMSAPHFQRRGLFEN